MSTTPRAVEKQSANEPRAASAPKPSNPARPSKFAGLNLRQRSSEQPATEPEPSPAPEPSPEGRGQLPDRSAASTEADLDRAGETPAPAPDKPGTEPIASGPITGAAESLSLPPTALSDEAEQPDRRTESRQQSAMSKLVTNTPDAKRSQAQTAGLDQAPTRRRGKRTDPEYVQVTAYVRQETYRRARIKLLQSTKPQEFSEVVEELLTRWLRASA